MRNSAITCSAPWLEWRMGWRDLYTAAHGGARKVGHIIVGSYPMCLDVETAMNGGPIGSPGSGMNLPDKPVDTKKVTELSG